MTRNRWLILANVSVGTFMATLDGSIANVALPTISAELDAPIHVVQWVLTCYLLAICATLPIAGKISDLFGRGRIYNYGFVAFAIGSAMCALADSLALLIVARIIQALGASCLMANSQAIVAEAFGANERGRAMGITGTTVSLGSLSGPALGGILVGQLGWESIFWINVPIGIIGFLAGLYLLPRAKAAKKGEPFDYAGSVLFMTGMVLFLYVLPNAQDWGWRSGLTLVGGLGSVLLLTAFYLYERRLTYPMLDFSLYRIRAFAVGNTTALLSFVALFCMNVMMPFYMQNVLGYSPEQTGYTMMVNPLTMAVIAPISGRLSDRFGPNWLTTAGLLINASAFALLNTLTADESAWVLAAHLALFGLGGGLFQSPNNASVMGAVPKPKLGTAGGLNALVRNIGMVTGIAVSVSLYSSVLGHWTGQGGEASAKPDSGAMLTALHAVFWTAAGICLLALFVSVRRFSGRAARTDGA